MQRTEISSTFDDSTTILCLSINFLFLNKFLAKYIKTSMSHNDSKRDTGYMRISFSAFFFHELFSPSLFLEYIFFFFTVTNTFNNAH